MIYTAYQYGSPTKDISLLSINTPSVFGHISEIEHDFSTLCLLKRANELLPCYDHGLAFP